MYLPIRQSHGYNAFYLVVRSSRPAPTPVNALRASQVPFRS